MKKLSLISFTKNGDCLNQTLVEKLSAKYQCCGYKLKRFSATAEDHPDGLCYLEGSVKEWVSSQFLKTDGFIFIGAVGIAVRLIAPHIGHKSKDPAVVVVDDGGTFAVSVLSGHMGGANQLTKEISKLLGAMPVITTATDVNEVFSVDLFAQKNDLLIADWKLAKEISAEVLAGHQVGFFSDLLVAGDIPDRIVRDQFCRRNIQITYRNDSKQDCLRLIPNMFVLGIGCKKGVTYRQLEAFIMDVLEQYQITIKSIAAICSIDLKKEEPGLLQFAEKYGLPCYFYTAPELERVTGRFADSPFVKQVTGTGNVCERAPMYHLQKNGQNGQIKITKQAGDGITMALIQKEIKISF